MKQTTKTRHGVRVMVDLASQHVLINVLSMIYVKKARNFND